MTRCTDKVLRLDDLGLSCETSPDGCRYKGGSLFEILDAVQPLTRDPLAPFRMSVIDKYKDMGTIAMGKSEAGIVRKGDRLYVMPNKYGHHSPPFHPACSSLLQ